MSRGVSSECPKTNVPECTSYPFFLRTGGAKPLLKFIKRNNRNRWDYRRREDLG
jgi:hypothetical protein